LNNKRVFSFVLIIFQSIGIRFFDGQGAVLAVIIILLSFSSFRKINEKDFLLFAFVTSLLVFNKVLNDSSFSISNLIIQISYFVGAYLFLIQYRLLAASQLVIEFFKALEIFCIHALFGYLIYLLFPSNFTPIPGTLNKTFYYIFYISNSDSFGITRNTGVFWEPGVFQLVANLYLFYCVMLRSGVLKTVFAFLLVLSSFSTTGLLLIVLSIFYLLFDSAKNKLKMITYIIFITLLALPIFPYISKNIADKFSSENTSGLVRMRDIYLGVELIKEKPILGHGLFDEKYLIEKGYTRKIEENIFSNEYMDVSGEMGGGFTNGFLGLFVSYGLPFGLITYIFLFRNRFCRSTILERLVLSLIILISMVTEPIFYTPLFLIFPLSSYILKNSFKIQT
jgi:hypothetical protein